MVIRINLRVLLRLNLFFLIQEEMGPGAPPQNIIITWERRKDIKPAIPDALPWEQRPFLAPKQRFQILF